MNLETLNGYVLAFVALLAMLLYVAVVVSGLRDLLNRRPNGFARVKRQKAQSRARDPRKVNKAK